MTMRSWGALPRKSISHGMIKIDEEENRVPGHRNPQEHIKSVFETVLCNPERVAADAEVYMIATEDSTEQLLKVLGESCECYAMPTMLFANDYSREVWVAYHRHGTHGRKCR
jgi:hypothetical protein